VNLSAGSPEILHPGEFKSTAWNNITYRLYRLIRAPAIRSEIAPCYEVKTVECASEVKRLLSRRVSRPASSSNIPTSMLSG
jgi:hypothetical protein